MTKKKIMQVPSESTEGPNVDSQNAPLAEVNQLGPSSLHFFDETPREIEELRSEIIIFFFFWAQNVLIWT